MKVSSCPNLNRESTSFPNFLTLLQDPEHHDDDTTLNKRPKLDPGDHTEDSETSPFKDILSPFVSSNKIGFSAVPSSFGMCRSESEQEDRTLSNSNFVFRSNNSSSVGSNEFGGGGGAGGSLWWDQCNHPDFPDNEFRHAFNMSKSTFNFICGQLDSFFDEGDKNKELELGFCFVTYAISLRVALCIRYLATGEPLSLVSKRFGLDIPTCRDLVVEVCGAINTVLMSEYINWPDWKKMKRIKSEFELVSGIPNVVGSLYTTLVPISTQVAYDPDPAYFNCPFCSAYFNSPYELAYSYSPPSASCGCGYFNKWHTQRNQKASYTVTLQGVVDCNGVFTDVYIGCPGSMSDDEILENSPLSQRAHGERLKVAWIVENTGYPLMDRVLVRYAQPDLGPQRVFNEKVGEVQRVAKVAFSRLKGRWRCLQEIKEVKLLHVPKVIDACCVLHNICEMRNEAMDPADTSFDLFDEEN